MALTDLDSGAMVEGVNRHLRITSTPSVAVDIHARLSASFKAVNGSSFPAHSGTGITYYRSGVPQPCQEGDLCTVLFGGASMANSYTDFFLSFEDGLSEPKRTFAVTLVVDEPCHPLHGMQASITLNLKDNERCAFLSSDRLPTGGVDGLDSACNSQQEMPAELWLQNMSPGRLGTRAFQALVGAAMLRVPPPNAQGWPLSASTAYALVGGGGQCPGSSAFMTTNALRVPVFPLASPLSTSTNSFWTGLALTPISGGFDWSNAEDCDAWNSSGISPDGAVGLASQTDSTAFAGGLRNCATMQPVLCVEVQ